jgi:hypothetical protein
MIEEDILGGRQQPFKAVHESYHLPTKLLRGLGDPSEHGVQARTIAAASQNANPLSGHTFLGRYL